MSRRKRPPRPDLPPADAWFPDAPALPPESRERRTDGLDPLTLLLHEVYAIDVEDPEQREVERDAQRTML